MRKNLYVMYDEKVKGVPSGTVFADFNDGVVIRGLQEQYKEKPCSKEIADDLYVIRVGSIDIQNDDINTVTIVPDNVIVGRLSDLLPFNDKSCDCS